MSDIGAHPSFSILKLKFTLKFVSTLSRRLLRQFSMSRVSQVGNSSPVIVFGPSLGDKSYNGATLVSSLHDVVRLYGTRTWLVVTLFDSENDMLWCPRTNDLVRLPKEQDLFYLGKEYNSYAHTSRAGYGFVSYDSCIKVKNPLTGRLVTLDEPDVKPDGVDMDYAVDRDGEFYVMAGFRDRLPFFLYSSRTKRWESRELPIKDKGSFNEGEGMDGCSWISKNYLGRVAMYNPVLDCTRFVELFEPPPKRTSVEAKYKFYKGCLYLFYVRWDTRLVVVAVYNELKLWQKLSQVTCPRFNEKIVLAEGGPYMFMYTFSFCGPGSSVVMVYDIDKCCWFSRQLCDVMGIHAYIPSYLNWTN
ncbi:hypothetical protein SELMODRAFT_424258 [Selaginella moellendorffii]|uniref:Uncharacterized protein n=1 Tax=Selaginella moellendorffii TaxID=88036 RepID=D8SPB2_SELML|nr:hypothetical protein SELMODRAFT_424258 [Selaginella moellendorffii]